MADNPYENNERGDSQQAVHNTQGPDIDAENFHRGGVEERRENRVIKIANGIFCGRLADGEGVEAFCVAKPVCDVCPCEPGEVCLSPAMEAVKGAGKVVPHDSKCSDGYNQDAKPEIDVSSFSGQLQGCGVVLVCLEIRSLLHKTGSL